MSSFDKTFIKRDKLPNTSTMLHHDSMDSTTNKQKSDEESNPLNEEPKRPPINKHAARLIKDQSTQSKQQMNYLNKSRNYSNKPRNYSNESKIDFNKSSYFNYNVDYNNNALEKNVEQGNGNTVAADTLPLMVLHKCIILEIAKY